jgi:hypothetical protein
MRMRSLAAGHERWSPRVSLGVTLRPCRARGCEAARRLGLAVAWLRAGRSWSPRLPGTPLLAALRSLLRYHAGRCAPSFTLPCSRLNGAERTRSLVVMAVALARALTS